MILINIIPKNIKFFGYAFIRLKVLMPFEDSFGRPATTFLLTKVKLVLQYGQRIIPLFSIAPQPIHLNSSLLIFISLLVMLMINLIYAKETINSLEFKSDF